MARKLDIKVAAVGGGSIQHFVGFVDNQRRIDSAMPSWSGSVQSNPTSIRVSVMGTPGLQYSLTITVADDGGAAPVKLLDNQVIQVAVDRGGTSALQLSI